MRRIISFILLLSMIVICCSCGAKKAKNEPYSNSFRAFDTMCSYTIYDDLSKKDLEDIRKKYSPLVLIMIMLSTNIHQTVL